VKERKKRETEFKKKKHSKKESIEFFFE